MSTTTELLDLINDLLGGGSPKVLKAEHKPVLEAIANSLLNKQTDSDLLGLLQHDPSKTYPIGAGTLKDGQLWQANQAIPIEAFNPSKWDQITGTVALSDYGINEWENDYPSGSGGGYSLNDKVVRDERLWNSDSNSNTDDPLTSGWTEISANDGKFGNDWAVGLYKQNQVVTNPTDKRLYYVAAASNFSSVDIDDEITSGDFVLFHDVGAMLTGSENNMIRFNASGNQEETDEIQVETGNVNIKTFQTLLTGAKIGKVNEDGDVIVRIGTDVAIVFSADNGVYLTGKNDFTKGWAGADDNGAGFGFGGEYVSVNSSGQLGFSKGVFFNQLVKTLITAPRNYTFPDKNITFAGLDDIIYGTAQDYIEDEAQSNTTLTTFQPKISHITPILPIGQYKIEFYCEMKKSASNSSTELFVQAGVITIAQPRFEPKDALNWVAMGGFKHITLGVAGTIDLSMDYRAVSSGTASIRRARMSITKIAN